MGERKAYRTRWPRKNLGEIINFLETQGSLKLEELEARLGMKRQYISSLFILDNMKLKTAERIADRYGFELKLFWPKKEFKYGVKPMNTKPMKEYPNAGNLTGLIKYIEDSNMSVHSFCCHCNVADTTIHRAFTTGNISISLLYDILRELRIEVIWKFEKKTAKN